MHHFVKFCRDRRLRTFLKVVQKNLQHTCLKRGRGGQRPFKQCLKKLHNWFGMASLNVMKVCCATGFSLRPRKKQACNQATTIIGIQQQKITEMIILCGNNKVRLSSLNEELIRKRGSYKTYRVSQKKWCIAISNSPVVLDVQIF